MNFFDKNYLLTKLMNALYQYVCDKENVCRVFWIGRITYSDGNI